MTISLPDIFLEMKERNTSAKLPVGTIYCLGKNFSEHIAELKWETPEPVIFIKPRTSIAHTADEILLPSFSQNIHFEVELVLYIGEKGANIEGKRAKSFIHGVGVGVDLTARDIQNEAKEKGHPWSVSKGFDGATLISQLILTEKIRDLNNCEILLRKNHELKQKENSSRMILDPFEVIEYVSGFFTLYPGDIIFTGTPKGVGPVYPGDEIEIELVEDNITKLIDKFKIR